MHSGLVTLLFACSISYTNAISCYCKSVITSNGQELPMQFVRQTVHSITKNYTDYVSFGDQICLNGTMCDTADIPSTNTGLTARCASITFDIDIPSAAMGSAVDTDAKASGVYRECLLVSMLVENTCATLKYGSQNIEACLCNGDKCNGSCVLRISSAFMLLMMMMITALFML